MTSLNDLDRTLLSYVRPPDWRNPEPAARYDLVVVGGGTAGLVCAVGAAGLGARVALVERARLGGDCLNSGCVPSKALLRAARAMLELRKAHEWSDEPSPAPPDIGAVIRHVRARQVAIAPHDSATRLASLGVHVFFGEAAFVDGRTIAVGGSALRFRRAVIATGSRPSVPGIAGLDEGPYLTTETLFSLTEPLRSLVVIGGGPVGCEMAQAFALLGTRVTLLESSARPLPADDGDAAAIVWRHLERSGVDVQVGARIDRVTWADQAVDVRLSSRSISADAVLVAAGRTPHIERLNLASAGIAADASGVAVDDHLRTSNPRVFTAGDVCSSYKFTHAADAMARVVLRNALFYGRSRVSALVIPWCTYTFPELAHVGLTATNVSQAGAATITVPLTENDRAMIDDESDGFVRIHHRRGRILGATVVAPHAGEVVGHLAHLIRTRGTLRDLSDTIFPYPTVADALRRAGDAYRRTSLTPRVRRGLERYFALLR